MSAELQVTDSLAPSMPRLAKERPTWGYERMIFFGERARQSIATCFLESLHAERNHQEIGNRLIAPGAEAGRTSGKIECRERLGGLVRYHYSEAAWPLSAYDAGL